MSSRWGKHGRENDRVREVFMKWGKTWTGMRDTRAQQKKHQHTRERSEEKRQTSRDCKQIDYMPLAHKHTHTHSWGERWWTVKLQSPSISVSPFSRTRLALTLPERLDLMTCWEGDRDRDRDRGEGRGGREGERKNEEEGEKKMTDERWQRVKRRTEEGEMDNWERRGAKVLRGCEKEEENDKHGMKWPFSQTFYAE